METTPSPESSSPRAAARAFSTAVATTRIVLVRPQGAANIGSVARVMANFGLSGLVLVAPRTDPLGPEARAMACSAQDLLENARIVQSLAAAVDGCRWVCGTTARVGERRRAELTPRTAGPAALRQSPAALVFGPEDMGLSGEELDHCHAVIKIPTAPRLQSLNLAQAVALVCYELWMAAQVEFPPGDPGPGPSDRSDRSVGSDRPGLLIGVSGQSGFSEKSDKSDGPAGVDTASRADRDSGRSTTATAGELEAALAHLERALDAIGFFRQTAPGHPMRDLRRFLARARPSRYELAMLRGMSRKTLNALRYGPSGKRTKD